MNNLKEKIDKICATNKTGYADLWMKKEDNILDYFEQYRRIRIKKWIKRLIGEL